MPNPVENPGSNWLDRLRISRDFSTSDNLSLPNSHSGSPTSKPGSDHSGKNPVRPPENEWFGIMTDVLSELFNFGDYDVNSRKKSCRKQTNPKSLNFAKKKVVDQIALGKLKEKKKLNGGDELLSMGYSRTEVTVIDTSCASWKFDKLLFRRRNDWKVRDKKWRNVGRKKKRKAGSSEDEDVFGERKKKRIAKVSILPHFNRVDDEDGGGEDCDVSLIEGRNLQNDKRKETFLDAPNIIGQVPEKRFCSPRSARKMIKGDTCSIHMNGARAVRKISPETENGQRTM